MRNHMNPQQRDLGIVRTVDPHGVARNSQVANIRHSTVDSLNLPPPFILSAPGAVGLKLKEVMEKRLTIQRQDRSSLHRELATVYHIGIFLLSNQEVWGAYCAEAGVKQTALTPRNVLRAVVASYSGNGKSAQKTASRYFRALIVSFEKKLSASALWNKMRTVGIDGLLRAANTKKSKCILARKRLASIKVSKNCLYSILLDGQTTQPLLLCNDDKGLWRYAVCVIRQRNTPGQSKVGAIKVDLKGNLPARFLQH